MANAPPFLTSPSFGASPPDQVYQIKKVGASLVTLSSPSGAREQVPPDQILLNSTPAPSSAIRIDSKVKRMQGQWILLEDEPMSPLKPGIAKGPPPMNPHSQNFGLQSAKPGVSMAAPQSGVSPLGPPKMGLPGPNSINKPGATGVSPVNPSKPSPAIPSPVNPPSPASTSPVSSFKPGPAGVSPMAKSGNSIGGKTGTVLKIEPDGVKLKIGTSLETVPLSSFKVAGSLRPDTKVRFNNGVWVVDGPSNPMASGPNPPSHSPPIPRAINSVPINTQATIKSRTIEKVTLICESLENPPIEVAISSIRTAQGQTVTAQQLGSKMRVRKVDESVWMLLDEPLQSQPQAPPKPIRPSNYLTIDAIDEIYPGDRAFLTEIKDFLTVKYAGLYWSRGTSICRSIAAFTFQCLLLEKKTEAAPIADSLQVRQSMGNYPDTALTIKNPDFEQTYAQEIDYIEKGITPLVGNSEGFDFTPLAQALQLAISVVRPIGQEPFYTCLKLFPPELKPYDKECQHLVLLAKPPYPVLITKKVASLLGNNMQIATPVKEFIYTKRKIEPPAMNRTLSAQIDKLRKMLKSLDPMSLRLVEYTGRLMSRLEQLIREGQVGADMCSSDVAGELAALWQILGTVDTTALVKDTELMGSLGTIRTVVGNTWGQFTVTCETCGNKYRDVVLECGHSLCSSCIDALIYTAQAHTAVLSSTEDITAISCPLCGNPISKAAIKAYNKELYEVLVAQVDQWTGLKECSQCEMKRPQGIVWEQDCKHTCCVICANNQTVFCRVCSAAWGDVPSSMSRWPLQCQACGDNFMASTLLPALCPALHIACPACMLKATKNNQCGVQICGKPFAYADLMTLKAKCIGTCLGCQRSMVFSELVETMCPCVICLECAGTFTRTHRNYLACWNCGTSFSQELANGLYEKLKLGELPACFWCGNIFCDIELACGDQIHTDCLYNYTLQQTKQVPMMRVDCGICGIEVYAELIFQYFSRETFPELAAANPEAVEVPCPNCRCSATVLTNLHQIYRIQCERCNHEYCGLCLEWDPDHLENRCKVVLAAYNIWEMEKKKIQCVQCPYCKCAAAKALGQASQSCEICQKQFCPECVVRLDSVKAHGEFYHRELCPQHSQQLDLTFKKECSLCNILGEPNGGENGDEGCKPPIRLARRGRFPPGFSY